MTSILIAAAVGLLVTLLGTPLAIRLFRLRGWGQRIREDGPHTHFEKMGTPTMGGMVILAGISAAYVVTRVVPSVGGGPASAFRGATAAGLAVLFATLGLGIVGFVDDYIKVSRRRSLGLSKAAKVAGQAFVAIGFAVLTVKVAGTSTDLSFIRDTGLKLGLVVFVVWAFLMLSAASNAVNLTDGLDGLASGSSILVLSGYVFIAFWQFRHTCEAVNAPACYPIGVRPALDIAIIAAGATGAAAGFLWWNAAPARIFMGDTGSLALGGLLGALAISTSTQLLLVVLGGLFVLETVSVIAQVLAFRLFHRRVLRMAPIHHHFELMGWPEFTVIVRFWIVAGLGVAVALGLFYTDFIARGGVG
jgi:phospho-N-acetylmuramoyl-pentapeptide-transferase